MKRTKIVCTLGPATDTKETIRELVLNGMNVARLNFSHGTHEEHAGRIQLVKEVRKELGIPVALMLDTKGPEIRTGELTCLLYTSPSPRDGLLSRMPSSA